MQPGASTIDINQYIDRQSFARLQWLVLIMCVLILAFDAIDLTVMGLIAPALSEQWGIDKAALGPALTSSIVGTCVGAMCGGPMADWFGRKRILVASTLSFGLFTVACAFAPTLGWLILLRFLGGLGIGSATPVANTLMSEFAPKRYRALCCNVLLVGFTLGATLGGLAASWLIPHWGWRSMLVLGGGIPVVLGLLQFALPESLQFMLLKQWPERQVAAVMERVEPGSGGLAQRLSVGDRKVPSSTNLKTPFAPRYLMGTIVLWAVYFLGLVIYYVMTSWLPTFVHSAGFSIAQSSIIMAMFPFGGVIGTLGLGLVMERLGSVKVIALTYALSGIFIWLVGTQGGSLPLLSVIVFVTGVTLNGAQLSMPSLSAMFYPTVARATGTAWMIGIGRVGGIVGAMAGGILLQLNWSFSSIFGVLAIPAFLSAGVLILASGVFGRETATQDDLALAAKPSLDRHNA